MPSGHAVVDGSNIATEGRSEPSLRQLDEAVTQFIAEHDFERVTVIVDASFEHRVAKSERKAARQAIDDNEIITPPAGVIGRGDTFILQVADRANAVVLSNDSFQEFHGTYEWLFDEGRLIGGKPIPGVGWVYVPRAPVRGPVSRRARAQAEEADAPPTKTPAKRTRKRSTKKAAAEAVKKVAAKASGRRGSSRSAKADSTASTADAAGANEAGVFRAFRHDHPLGSTVTATVESFSSHGAYARVGDASVYLPLRLLADPAPRRARDVVSVGESREFVVHRFDDDRRGIDAGIIPLDGSSGQNDVSTSQSDTNTRTKGPTVAAKKAAKKATKKSAKKAPAKKAAPKKAAKKAPAKKAAKKSTAKKAAKKAPAKKAAPKKAAKKSAKKAAAKKAAKKSTAKKAAKKSTAKKAAKKSTAKKAPAKKAGAKKAAKKAPAKRAKKAAKKRR